MGQDRQIRATISVSEAGEILGISRNAAYAAASRGELPVVKIGRRLLVPTQRLHEMLGTAQVPPATAGDELVPAGRTRQGGPW